MIFLGWSYHINSVFGDHCHAETWNQCRWDAFCFCMVDKIWCYLSAFMIPLVLKRSPTPLAEIKPKTMAEPSLCFTDGCRLLYLSPDFQNVKIWIHHSIRPSHLFLVQHLYSWHTSVFSPSFPPLRVVSLVTIHLRSFLMINYRTRCLSQVLR